MSANWQTRTLLFRLYLLLALGLVGMAALLDYGFRELQARLDQDRQPWREAGFGLIAGRLADTPAAERGALAAELSRELGLPVRFLPADDVVGARLAPGEVQELADADGRLTWLSLDAARGVVTRVGPVEPPRENPWLNLVPPLFYLAIFVLVGLWLRPVLKDLGTITASTRTFAADYRAWQPTAQRVTSLRELAANFDAMAARLGSLIQGQKELTSALSHEMRTPLARIRFALAVVGDRAGAREREELEAIGADVQEIDRLIATMLSYARLDHPDTRMNQEGVPAEAWLLQTVERSRLPEVEVSVRVGEGVDELRMDRRLMSLTLSNLVVNACRHARSRVEVTASREGDAFQLDVDDDGEGIPEAERVRVFKAFTRLDGSRNRGTGGSGLGLAIVARIAELHGGKAEAGESPTLGGARVSIRWPRAA